MNRCIICSNFSTEKICETCSKALEKLNHHVYNRLIRTCASDQQKRELRMPPEEDGDIND